MFHLFLLTNIFIYLSNVLVCSLHHPISLGTIKLAQFYAALCNFLRST